MSTTEQCKTIESNDSLVMKGISKAIKTRNFLMIAVVDGKVATILTEKAYNEYCKLKKLRCSNIFKQENGNFQIRKRVNGTSNVLEDSDSVGKDWSGFSGKDLRADFLGCPEYVDLNRPPAEWLPDSEGALDALYDRSCVLVRHNLSLRGNEKNEKIEAIKAICSVLKKIKLDEDNYYPNFRLGYLILTLVSADDLTLLQNNFEGLFEVVSLDGEKTVVESAKEVEPDEEQVDVPVVDKNKEKFTSNLKGNIFRYKGGHWEITFDGKKIFPKNKKGFSYISYVLSNPKEEFHNFSLYQFINNPVAGSVTKEQSFDAKINPERSTKVSATKGDKRDDYLNYKKMLDELEEEDKDLNIEKSELEIDGVNMSRLNEINEKLDQSKEIRKLISKDFKSDGNDKSAKEKIIYNVYMNIYRSLLTIKQEHPSLHLHLKTFLTNSKEYSSYRPDRDICWQTNHS